MRKFAIRWWADDEFLGRRLNHNCDTAELLLEDYGFSVRCGTWSYAAPFWDVALRGPKTSTAYSRNAVVFAGEVADN